MKTLFIFLWVLITILFIGWGILSFILAKSLELSWINWLGVLTVPTGIAGVIVVLIQRKMFKNTNF